LPFARVVLRKVCIKCAADMSDAGIAACIEYFYQDKTSRFRELLETEYLLPTIKEA